MTAVKGIRKDGSNATSLEALTATAVTVLTVTTGRTFVLTDLIVTGRATATAIITQPVVRLYDETAGENTAPTAALQKFAVIVPLEPVIASADPTTLSGMAQPVVITNIQNGPEFSTEVSAASIGFTHFVISANAIWVGGVER